MLRVLEQNHLRDVKQGGGDASILSFNGNKIITTSGGGMLITKHEEWAKEARFLSTQARDPAPHYEHSTIGTTIDYQIYAAIGLGQIEVLIRELISEEEYFRYADGLSMPGIRFMPETKGHRSTRWLTTLTIDPNICGVNKDEIMES